MVVIISSFPEKTVKQIKLLQETAQVPTPVEILRLEEGHSCLKAGSVHVRVREGWMLPCDLISQVQFFFCTFRGNNNWELFMTFVGIAGSRHQLEFKLFVRIFLASTKMSTACKDEVSIPDAFAILILSALLRASQRPCI